jgi:hypothetical protein
MADPSVVQTQSEFRLCYKQAYAWTMIEVNFRSRDRLDRLTLPALRRTKVVIPGASCNQGSASITAMSPSPSLSK